MSGGVRAEVPSAAWGEPLGLVLSATNPVCNAGQSGHRFGACGGGVVNMGGTELGPSDNTHKKPHIHPNSP